MPWISPAQGSFPFVPLKLAKVRKVCAGIEFAVAAPRKSTRATNIFTSLRLKSFTASSLTPNEFDGNGQSAPITRKSTGRALGSRWCDSLGRRDAFDPGHDSWHLYADPGGFCAAIMAEVMSVEDHFRQAYKEGSPPWDIGKPDFNLVQTVTTLPIASCKALEIGCGTGDNAIWLAQQGFQVVGVDSSDIAIQKAHEKAEIAKSICIFAVLDFLKSHVKGAPFGFAFDRGCFHAMGSDEDRTRFAEQVHRHLEDGGLWLSLIGNADEKRDRTGPPQRTARQIANATEPYFEILSLVSSHFEANLPYQPRAWVCLMKKRSVRD